MGGLLREDFLAPRKRRLPTSQDELNWGKRENRFLEIGNLSNLRSIRERKMEPLTPLPKPSIDTGMGLERVVAIKEGVSNNYHSSLFMPYLRGLGSF